MPIFVSVTRRISTATQRIIEKITNGISACLLVMLLFCSVEIVKIVLESEIFGSLQISDARLPSQWASMFCSPHSISFL